MEERWVLEKEHVSVDEKTGKLVDDSTGKVVSFESIDKIVSQERVKGTIPHDPIGSPFDAKLLTKT